jgi:hypothetical protein
MLLMDIKFLIEKFCGAQKRGKKWFSEIHEAWLHFKTD